MQGGGREQGGGRGRMGGKGLGLAVTVSALPVEPEFRTREAIPVNQRACPKCGAKMTR